MIKRCPECNEEIVWNDDIFIGEDGEVYHATCVTAYPNGFTLFSLDGNCLTVTEDIDSMAVCVLDSGEYIDDEEI